MRDSAYTCPEVRDLAWCLGSPALLRRRDAHVQWPRDDWYETISGQFHGELLRLDARPRPLHEHLAQRRDPRLGNYFETLWRFWLEHNPRYRLLYANLPVRARGRTLGEFDFLVQDLEHDRTLHWELAVKFYLGSGDTASPANWWGPGRRDRLALKTEHLLHHQSRLSQCSEARELLAQRGLRIDETWVIMKGRLFYPRGSDSDPPRGASPQHLRGFWLPRESLSECGRTRWQVLDRRQWFAPLAASQVQGMNTADLRACWDADRPDFPICVAIVHDGEESERGFIVPDGWEQRADQPL